jgi:hypothetical protein
MDGGQLRNPRYKLNGLTLDPICSDNVFMMENTSENDEYDDDPMRLAIR